MSDRVNDWVVRADDERPARPDGRCFYCSQPIGGTHLFDCVIPQRYARVRFTVEIDVLVPHHWSDDMVGYRYNDSTWCADNLPDLIQDDIERLTAVHRCLCAAFKAEVVHPGGEQ